VAQQLPTMLQPSSLQSDMFYAPRSNTYSEHDSDILAQILVPVPWRESIPYIGSEPAISVSWDAVDRTPRKRAGTRQAGSEPQPKQQKRDVSSSTEPSSRETSTTMTTTSNKLTSTTTASDTGSSPGSHAGTDTTHNAPHDDAGNTPPADDTDQAPAATPPPAELHGAHFESFHLSFFDVWHIGIWSLNVDEWS